MQHVSKKRKSVPNSFPFPQLLRHCPLFIISDYGSSRIALFHVNRHFHEIKALAIGKVARLEEKASYIRREERLRMVGRAFRAATI